MVHTPDRPFYGAHPYPPRRLLPPDVAAMLLAARRRRGWSLRRAAREIGVTFGTVAHLEHSRRAPSERVAVDVIAAYGLPPADAARLLDAAVTDKGRSGPYYRGPRRKRMTREMAESAAQLAALAPRWPA